MSPSPHNFRYELELCTLPEGATLAQWRRGYDDPLVEAETAAGRGSRGRARDRTRLLPLLRRRRRPPVA